MNWRSGKDFSEPTQEIGKSPSSRRSLIYWAVTETGVRGTRDRGEAVLFDGLEAGWDEGLGAL